MRYESYGKAIDPPARRCRSVGKMLAKCVPGRQSVASFALHASQKRSRTGKSPVRGKIRAPCIRKRAGFGKTSAPCIRNAPQTAVGGYTARISCREGALFAARAPRITHSAQILPFLGAPFERFDLFRVGWGGARGSRTALALYGAVLVFRALSPFVRGGAAVSWVRSHAASSCSPPPHKMLLLSRPPSRETCPLLPCEVCVHSASSHAGQAHSPRVAGYVPSPSTRLLPCASVSRRRALLIWLGFRMGPALASLSSRPRRGRSGGIVSFAAENMAL